MAKMTVAEKNTLIKTQAVNATILPEGTIQIDDFSYAIPVTVEGEERYAVVTFVAKNNKATKTSEAFTPESAIAKWEEDKRIAEAKAAERLAEKERKAKLRAERQSKAKVEKN